MMKYFFLFLFFTFNLYSQFETFYHPELEWRTIETEHFLIHYHNGTSRTAKTVSKIAEEIYEPITSLYNHFPDQKISIIIKDYDDYSNGAAYFYDNKIEIWATSLDFDLRGNHNWLRNVITHEFTHIIQIQTAMKFGRKIPSFYLQWLNYEEERRNDVLYGFPNVIVSYPISGFVVPSWFAEGVAQYNRRELSYDFWDTHRDMILRMYAIDSNMLSWNEMSVFGKTSLGNESSYNAGFAFVKFLSEKYGSDIVEKISRTLSNFSAITIDEAIKNTTGIDGKIVFDEWKNYLYSSYFERIKNLKTNLIEGEKIADVGFANFYPTFTQDGKKIFYVSNKDADYFFQSSIYLYDLETKEEEKIVDGIRSTISLTQDGKKIFYSKTTSENPHWSKTNDIFYYDFENEKEIRLTHSLRASSPNVSSDGKKITFISGSDGTLNLFVTYMDRTTNIIERTNQLTNFKNGEQIYNPKFSSDSKKIIFDYSIKDGRDVAIFDLEKNNFEFLFATKNDERNAQFFNSDKKIIYSSDKTGVFNLYTFDLETNEETQISNVVGGAFMPSISIDGKIAYSNYTSSGYKISLLDSISKDEIKFSYKKNTDTFFISNQQLDYEKLRNYNDSMISKPKSKKYKNIFTSFTFYPFLRFDNYNKFSQEIEKIKPGIYFTSNDVLDKYGIYGTVSLNSKLERDMFLSFEYRGKILGLYNLGFEPITTFEIFNVSRKTNFVATLRKIGSPIYIPLDVSFNLLQTDISLHQKVFSENLEFEMRFSHSRYNSTIESFLFYDPLDECGEKILIPASDENYYIGNTFSLQLKYDALKPSRFGEINPNGRKIFGKYEYESSDFNPSYEIQDGYLVRNYENPKFHKLTLKWNEHAKLPFYHQTISSFVYFGKIFSKNKVDDFFDFYLGGLVGMKGYPYYAIGGSKILLLNFTHRFPILENIDIRFYQIYFDKLYGSFYFDVGDAWKDEKMLERKFKKDVGFELRTEAFYWYSFPTRIFFNTSYAFDKIERVDKSNDEVLTYGKEFRFYFGILFGFELE